MKLTAIFLFAFTINVLARGYSQEVTLKMSHTSLEKVFDEIRKQTGYVFFYKTDLLRDIAKINVRVKNASIADAMKACLAELPLSYVIIDKTIVVNGKHGAPEEKVMEGSPPADIEVTGEVKTEAGIPLAGASIKLKGATIGTSTDANGSFTLSIPATGGILEISFVGFDPVEVAVKKNQHLSIQLKQKDARVEEVVVIGYGSVKRSNLTGSVSSVSSDKITQVKAVSNVAQTLQGQAAGVQVAQRSGQPGENVSIKIRGTNSIAASSDPLYVVDGLPLDGLSAQLNPSDIENIEVLKDASSTAIYGSRGANGVIMITTKKGKEGRVQVSYDGYYGSQSLRKKIPLINAQEFAKLQNEVAANDGTAIKWTPAQIDSLAGKGTDWQDLVYRNAPVQNHDLSISGGGAGTRYYTSFGYYNQDGIIQNSNFKRFSFRGNLDQKINDKLSTNISLSLQQSNYFQSDYVNADFGGIPFQTMVMPPTVGVYDAAGKYTVFQGVPWGQTNPYGMAKDEWRPSQSLRLIGNAVINYAITKDLKLKLSAGIDDSWNRSDYYAPNTITFNTVFGASKNYGNSNTFINENLLNYTKNFDKHSIDVVGGVTYQDSKSELLNSGSAFGFLTDIYQDYNIQAATTHAQPSTGYSDSKLISYLGRVNYSFANRYLLTITGRYDGSSKFSENNKYAFFPSGALGWRVSQESFMQGLKAVSNLKLRASYGFSGNQGINPYQTLGSLGSVNVILGNAPTTGYVLDRLENKSLKWETTKQLDIGVDLGLFNERIQFTADYYDKKTSDLLLNVTVPPSSGFGTVLENVGEVGNKGYELQLTTKNLTGLLSWNSLLTFTHNRTKILDLGKDAAGKPITYKEIGTGGNWFPMILGQSMQQLYGYKITGVYQSDAEAVQNGEPTKKAGDYKFQNTDGNNVVDGNDRIVLSHFEPKFTYGFNNNFSYGNFNLAVLIVGSYGNDIANEFRKYNITLNGNWVPSREAYNNRWVQGKGTSVFDKPSVNSGSTIRDYANSLWVENGSYLRVRDITLAYNIPQAVLKSVKIASIQLYVSAQNYITITKYTGYDPEASWDQGNITPRINGWDRGVYPSMKSIIGGVKINF